MHMKKTLLLGCVLTTLFISSCNAEEKARAQIIDNTAAITASIENADRPAKDKEDDSIRKSAEVLKFSGIAPGMTVMELEAGSGYYTEMMSRIVGGSGKIIMQNPQSFDTFFKPDTFTSRLGADGNRLGNVTHSRTLFDALDAADASVDLVTWYLGPHELWLKDKDGELNLGDPATVYSEIFRVLKPGGTFIALDHKAASGAPVTTGGTTHRIDPAHVTTFAQAAGLKLVDTSDVLANAEDDYSLLVFDPKVRRKTDRFLHKYTKPK